MNAGNENTTNITGVVSMLRGTGSGKAFGFYSNLSNVGTGYTKYGIYSQGEDKNYFSGHVGIGTTMPSINNGWGRVLEVANPLLSKIITTSSDNSTLITGLFSHSNNGYTWCGINGPVGALGTETDHPLVISTNLWHNSVNPTMIMQTNGNVGIGTNGNIGANSPNGFERNLVVEGVNHSRIMSSSRGNGSTIPEVRSGIYTFNNNWYGAGQASAMGTETEHPLYISTYWHHASTRDAALTILTNRNIGVNNMNPLNRQEIKETENPGSPSTGNHNGSSGLRFTNLTNSSPYYISESFKPRGVLSVDDEGDLIYLPSFSSNDNIYNSDGTLTDNRKVEMNNKSIFFGNSTPNATNTFMISSENVGMKYSASKLAVINRRSDENNAVGTDTRAFTNGTASAVGISSYGSNNSGCGSATGGLFKGEARESFGVSGMAISPTECTNEYNNLNQAVGGYFSSISSTITGYDAAIEAHSGNSLGSTTLNSYAGLFYGDAYYAGGTFISSDKKLKKDIVNIENALSIINKIYPKKYSFDIEKYPSLGLPKNSENYGVIAQELENILPSLIKEIPVPKNSDSNDKTFGIKTGEYIKSVNYTELIPIAIQAIKELNTKVESQNNAVIENETLKAKVSDLESKLASYDEKFALLEKSIATICESGCAGLEKKTIEVDVLYQSIPNPTDDIALINYYLASEKSNAEIRIYMSEGQTIETFKLNTKQGNGSVKVSLGNLSSGTYLYTLIANGKVVDTKRLQIVK